MKRGEFLQEHVVIVINRKFNFEASIIVLYDHLTHIKVNKTNVHLLLVYEYVKG